MQMSVFIQRISVFIQNSFTTKETRAVHIACRVLSGECESPELTAIPRQRVGFMKSFVWIISIFTKSCCVKIHWCQKLIDQNVIKPEGTLELICPVRLCIVSQRKKKKLTKHVNHLCSFLFILSKFALFAISDGRVVSDNLETNKSQIVFLCQWLLIITVVQKFLTLNLQFFLSILSKLTILLLVWAELWLDDQKIYFLTKDSLPL